MVKYALSIFEYNLLMGDLKVLGENGLIALGRDWFHRIRLSPTNLLLLKHELSCHLNGLDR